MNWNYKGEVFDKTEEEILGAGLFSFVYLITNLESGRLYIGKKLFLFKGKKTIKLKNGKKKKKSILVESDWKTYFGSCEEMNKDIEKLGQDKFKREIIHLCTSKAEASYLELKEQIVNEAILSDKYYNSYVGARIHRGHVKMLRKS
jgi:hypothetical protein